MIIPVNWKGQLAAEGDFKLWLKEWISHVTACLKTVGVKNIVHEINETKNEILKLLDDENDSDAISLAMKLPSSFYPKMKHFSLFRLTM